MSLYGNIANTTNIAFQFDKIYPNRYTMEAMIREDNIFAGRFVLVEYDETGNFSSMNILTGYLNTNDPDDHSIYIDADCTKPYLWVSFTPVSEVVSSNWNKYFYAHEVEGHTYYFKIPSQDYLDLQENNYYTVIGNISDEDLNRVVTTDQIICIREPSGSLTSIYYKCFQGVTQGQLAVFEEIGNLAGYNTYFKNFMIDRNYYGDIAGSYLNRGYDATIWRKEYGEGVGRYVLIAHLNGTIPSIEIVQDAPSAQPQAPSIDGFSSTERLIVRSPSIWGFRVKEAGLNDLSDMQGIQTDYEYDEYNNIIASTDTLKDLKIYFNKDGANKEISNIDLETPNEIQITPTGISGKVYKNQETAPDIQELSVYFPALGNMIAEGYDLFYGKDVLNKRYLDVDWYQADDPSKNTGLVILNGKTFDLNTIAGCINTIHNRLGQIIQELESYPSLEEIDSTLSEDIIYYVKPLEKYYRKIKYDYFEPVDSSYISYSEVDPPLTSEEYRTNTYYTKDGNSYEIATDTFSDSTTYWQKNIEADVYKLIDPPLTAYLPNTFYRKLGKDYILDTAEQPSSPYRQQYFTIDPNDIVLQDQLEREYRPNLFYRKDVNNNLILASENAPDSSINYYNINPDNTYVNVIFYQPNVFFYRDNQNILRLDDSSTVTNGRQYYYYVFKDEPTYGLDSNGNIIVTYPIDDTKTQGPYIGGTQLIQLPVNTENVYFLQDNNYINYQNIDSVQTSGNLPARLVVRTYVTLTVTDITNTLYVAGKYYIHIDNNYILSVESYDEQTDYYLILDATQIPSNFYLPNTYYYKDTDNIYKIDYSVRKQNRNYYQKQNLFVAEDLTGRWPVGYEWNNDALFVPASVTLGVKDERYDFKELIGINNGKTSLNGLILETDKFIDYTNETSRNINTLKGIHNKLTDLFYTIDQFSPGKMLYVNNFGQIVTTSVSYKEFYDTFSQFNSLASTISNLQQSINTLKPKVDRMEERRYNPVGRIIKNAYYDANYNQLELANATSSETRMYIGIENNILVPAGYSLHIVNLTTRTYVENNLVLQINGLGYIKPSNAGFQFTTTSNAEIITGLENVILDVKSIGTPIENATPKYTSDFSLGENGTWTNTTNNDYYLFVCFEVFKENGGENGYSSAILTDEDIPNLLNKIMIIVKPSEN